MKRIYSLIKSLINSLINSLHRSVLLCTLVLLASSSLANTEANISPDQINWKDFNITIAKQQISPAYRALSKHMNTLHHATLELCSAMAISDKKDEAIEQAFKDTGEAFHQAMDAWQRIQHLNFGPIQYSERAARLQFWPDKKNHIGKKLATLIAAQNKQDLEAEKLMRASVAIQGLPAIERILFTPNSLNALQQSPFKCDVLSAISTNLASLTSALYDDWQHDMLPQFLDSQQLDGYFEDDVDAATALLKTMVEPLEIIVDLKLNRPLGSAFGKQKFKRLESWRSERSLRNMQSNLQSIQYMIFGTKDFDGFIAFLSEQNQLKLIKQWGVLDKTLSKLTKPIEQTIDEAHGYRHLEQLSQSIRALQQLLEKNVSKLGIHLGFNSRDGD